MALAVIMLQGGMREVMQAQGSVWELKLMELVTMRSALLHSDSRQRRIGSNSRSLSRSALLECG